MYLIVGVLLHLHKEAFGKRTANTINIVLCSIVAASFACSFVLTGFVFPCVVENQIKRHSTEVNSLQLFRKFVELD